MGRTKRSLVSWDYNILHKTGKRIPRIRKTSVEIDSGEMSETKEILSPDTKSITNSEIEYYEEIDEFLKENLLRDAFSIEDINNNLSEIKELRRVYKRIHREIKYVLTEYNENFEARLVNHLEKISDYIADANIEKKRRLAEVEAKESFERREEKRMEMERNNKKEKKLEQDKAISEVKIKEINEKIKYIENCCISMTSCHDDEILDLKSNLHLIDKELSELKEMKEKLENFISEFDNKQKIIIDLTNEYSHLKKRVIEYKDNLKEEVKKRELQDYKLKAVAELNIEIPKFSGLNSKIDVYTFQSKFEEQHARLPKNRWIYQLKEIFLIGQAKEMVKSIDDIDEIWKILKDSFGDPKILLNNELDCVRNLGLLWKIKDHQELSFALSKLANAMENLSKSAKTHKIEYELYNSHTEGMVYEIIGNERIDKFLEKCEGKSLSIEEEWHELKEFLRDESKRKSKMALRCKTLSGYTQKSTHDTTRLLSRNNTKGVYYNEDNQEIVNGQESRSHFGAQLNEVKLQCKSCGGLDCEYEGGHFEYIMCKEFRKMTPRERLMKLKNDKICFQCLQTNHKVDPYNRTDRYKSCNAQYVCQDSYHKKFNKGFHVLICQEHETNTGNAELLERYKLKVFKTKENIPEDIRVPKCYNYIAATPIYRTQSNSMKAINGNLDQNRKQTDSAVYMFQRIEIDGQKYNLFFDSGCGDLVCKRESANRLGKRANQEVPGPKQLLGVGDKVLVSKHGIWKIRLPMADGGDAVMSGVCLDKITCKFPEYEFDGTVSNDIINYCRLNEIDEKEIPKFPKKSGGETDIMIGIQYKKYFPVEVLRLPTGLTLYESKFMGIDGTRGLIAGPHPSFTKTEARYGNQFVSKIFNTAMLHEVDIGTSINPSINIIQHKENGDINKDIDIGEQSYYGKVKRKYETHEAVESAGTVCNYRCIDCRKCEKCKAGDTIESISLEEEYEQYLIDRSITVDIIEGVCYATLPFIENPENVLEPNRLESLKIFHQQQQRLDKCIRSKNEVVSSEKKLQDMGYVDYVENLSLEQRKMLQDSKIHYYIPWRSVWNTNSITTPCRLVFDGSHTVGDKRSLNSLLAKGQNNMNKLLEIVIRWSMHKVAFHSDIQKMYNTVRLKEEYWCFQRYLWREGLDKSKPIKEKIIKTIIYGVKSSGNQAEKALRETANKMKSEYPVVSKVIINDIYVDDCLSGEGSWSDSSSLTDDLKVVLNRGGFALKGFTFSGQDPPDHLSEDRKSIKVAGMIWYPKEDVLQLNTGELNFSRKRRGRKNTNESGVIPVELTRRQCMGKVAEIFDLTGKVTPIVAGMKLDLRVLQQRNLQWDDVIPNDLRQIWISNFEMMQDISTLRFERTIIPIDAESTDIETLDFGDSSNSLICAAIYARIKRKTGDYSCQLVFSRSRILPEGTTIPRGELAAAHLNAITGFVVKRSFGDYHKGCTKITDSQVTLFWIHSHDKPLKQWVRSRVIEINRLSDSSQWVFISSRNNVADIGTRRGVQLKEVDQTSLWRNGYSWMQEKEQDFPTMTIEDIPLKNIKEKVNQELHKYGQLMDALDLSCGTDYKKDDVKGCFVNKTSCNKLVPETVSTRYGFCNYLIDPNKYRLRKVLRILALVIRFIRNIRQTKKTSKVKGCIKEIPNEIKEVKGCDAVVLTDAELMSALEYYYRKSTLEIIQFRKKRQYENISEEVDGILYYKGRILLEQNISGSKNMCDVMIDLSCRTFWVPLVDRFSPFAYSIVNEVHWYNKEAKHTGVEKVLRYTLNYAHILEGRELVRMIRKSCTKCRQLAKEQIKVIMGPRSKHNLNIAPAFYVSQVDLLGPLESYHGTNKRSKLKIWFIVFCCCTTGATNLKVMESYATSSFILGFKRFSSQVGYPKVLLPDPGSQLIKGCSEMNLRFRDIKSRLNTEYGVEFEVCPVGAHYVHGKVERKMRQIRESISRSLDGYKLSTIGWETLGAEIANCINDLPIGIINPKADIDNLDLLTPNRLLLGRNNDRSPTEPVSITGRYDKIIESNNEIFRVWFKCWLIQYVPLLMRQQKWFESDRELAIGDIIMFKKAEKELECKYRYGKIRNLCPSKDGVVRTVIVEYQNSDENVRRTTTRGVRELILIQHVDEDGVMPQLGEANRAV